MPKIKTNIAPSEKKPSVLQHEIEQGQKALGERLRLAREEKEYTLAKLSEVLKQRDPRNIGLSPAQISRFENGETSPNFAEAKLLSNALGIGISYIYGQDPNPFFVIRWDTIQTRLKEVIEGKRTIERRDKHFQYPIRHKIYQYIPLVKKDGYVDIGEFQGELDYFMRATLFRIEGANEYEMKSTVESHSGQEIIFIIEGEVDFWYEQANDHNNRDHIKRITLKEKDFLQFSSRLKHGFSRAGKNEYALALFVFAEPRVTPPLMDELENDSGIAVKAQKDRKTLKPRKKGASEG